MHRRKSLCFYENAPLGGTVNCGVSQSALSGVNEPVEKSQVVHSSAYACLERANPTNNIMIKPSKDHHQCCQAPWLT